MAKGKKSAAIPAAVPAEMAAFLRALVANPNDRTTRLVFADWLDERADPRSAWLRDDDVWKIARRNLVHWFTPDPRGFLAPLVDALDPFAVENQGDWTAVTLLTALGTPAVGAVRTWVREGVTYPRWDMARGIIAAHPPANLRPVKELIKRLAHDDWYECWEAATDLRFHGPAAAPAVKALVRESTGHRFALENHEGWNPIEAAVYQALGAIGPAATAAVPALAGAVWHSEEAADALFAIRPDPDLVAEHINCDDDRSAGRGVELVRDLDPTGTGALVRLLRQSGRRGQAAAEILGEMGAEAADAVPEMIEAFERVKRQWNGDYMCLLLAKAFANIGAPARAAVPALRAALAGYAAGTISGTAAAARDAIAAALATLDPAGPPTTKPVKKAGRKK